MLEHASIRTITDNNKLVIENKQSLNEIPDKIHIDRWEDMYEFGHIYQIFLVWAGHEVGE